MSDVGCWNALSLQSPHPNILAFWGWAQTVTYNYVNFKPYRLLTLLSDSSECVRDLPKEHQVESKSTGQGQYRLALELLSAAVEQPWERLLTAQHMWKRDLGPGSEAWAAPPALLQPMTLSYLVLGA